METYGFNQVHRLSSTDRYEGTADVVMLVWHENQLLPAEQYRRANYPDRIVDIAICEDPKVQRTQLGDKAIIYNF